jgi:tetratricopeptide (TPR) repeat protein
MEAYEDQGALADLTRAVELDPAHIEAYYHRGLLAMWNLEDDALALADMSQVIELDPDRAMAYLYRGRVHSGHSENYEAALADYARFIELKPDAPEGYAGRGEIYLDGLGEFEQAVAEYALAIERDPEAAYLYVQRAWAYVGQERLDLAIADMDRALALEPDTETYFDRGAMNYGAGRYDAALDDFDLVLLMGWEGQGGAHYGRGRALAALGQYADAIAAYDAAAMHNWEDYLSPYLGDTHLLLDRAIAYRESGRFEEALADLNALIAEGDDWFRVYYERAATYRAMGETERARADLQQAWDDAEDDEWRARIEEEIRALQ